MKKSVAAGVLYFGRALKSQTEASIVVWSKSSVTFKFRSPEVNAIFNTLEAIFFFTLKAGPLPSTTLKQEAYLANSTQVYKL